MKRAHLLLLCVLGSALVVTAGSSAVVGGSAAEIGQAPWQVLVAQMRGNRTIGTCGGSIIDASRVVTAAHCVYGGFGAPVSPSSLAIRAGISDYTTPHPGDLEQARTVVSYRIHPGYDQRSNESYDDIAVLSLDTPLDLSGPTAKAASLPRGGSTFLSGQEASIAGFGLQQAGSAANGGLYRINATLEDQADCGTFNAIVVCASSATGSACSGDSGSGLVVGSTLVGVASTAHNGCPAGGRVVYTSVAAPEILRFVEGNDAPPAAPRRPETATLDAPSALQVGQTLTCDPGVWTNQPTYTYRFLDDKSGALLQQGRSATYVLKTADQGRKIECAVSATTEGGTGVARTRATAAVAAAPTLMAAHATATRGTTVKVGVTVQGLRKVSGAAEVCVKPTRTVGAKACRTTQLTGTANRVTVAVPVVVKYDAPVLTARVAISARLADGRKLTTVGSIAIARSPSPG